MKAELKLRPFIVITVVMVISIFIFGFIVRIFEITFVDSDGGDSYSTFGAFIDTMWLIIVTMTTTGYGDMYARTNTGRFFSILSFIIG